MRSKTSFGVIGRSEPTASATAGAWTPSGHREAGPQVALAPPGARSVDRERDRVEPALDGLVDQRFVTPRSEKQ